jgi:hypothetical protein
MTISGQDRRQQLANRIEVALRTVIEVGLDCIVLPSVILLWAVQTSIRLLKRLFQTRKDEVAAGPNY